MSALSFIAWFAFGAGFAFASHQGLQQYGGSLGGIGTRVFADMPVAKKRRMLRMDIAFDVVIASALLVESHYNFAELSSGQDELAPIGLGVLACAVFLFWKLWQLPKTEPEGKKIGGDEQQ